MLTPENAKEFDSGAVYQFSYPFVKNVQPADDEIGAWRPGVFLVETHTGGQEAKADGVGQQIVTIVGRYKPAKYPERIFFTRQWRDPSGRIFGKASLRVKTVGGLRTILRGYRYEFELTSRAEASSK